jgi:DNA-binding NarL/FixJ family response regulator
MTIMTNDQVSSARPRPSGYNLTNRETQVLGHLVAGLTNQQIAGKLGLEFYTVTTHLKNIYKKLRTHKRTQVVAKVLTEGILHGPVPRDLPPSRPGPRAGWRAKIAMTT